MLVRGGVVSSLSVVRQGITEAEVSAPVEAKLAVPDVGFRVLVRHAAGVWLGVEGSLWLAVDCLAREGSRSWCVRLLG